MARVHPFQTNFTAGELTSKLAGQVDFKKYNNGVPQIISSQFIADTDTPVSTLLKISKNLKISNKGSHLEKTTFSIIYCRYNITFCEFSKIFLYIFLINYLLQIN